MSQKISRRQDVRIIIIALVLLVLYVAGYLFVASSHSVTGGFVEQWNYSSQNDLVFQSGNWWDRVLYYVFLPAGCMDQAYTQLIWGDDTVLTYTLR